MRETTSERKQPFVKITKIPIDAVAESLRRRKRRFDPVDSVKATRCEKVCLFKGRPICHIIRKTDFCLGENKGADQLCSSCTADQHLCFPYFFCDSTGQFVSDLVGNPEDPFSSYHSELR